MLPEETSKVWDFLKFQRAMESFVLVGGSALSLRIDHRFSEDLDVAFIGLRLPTARLSALSRSFGERGFSIVPTDDPAAAFEFEAAGADLRDYQQDFLVNGKVKLSFFTADACLTQLLKSEDSNTVRIASLDELFASKALVCASRSTTRDWFDMRTLIQDHNFTVADIHNVFERVRNPMGFSIAMQRLCSGKPQAGDPGLAPLVELPPSADEFASFFQTKRNEFETQRASDVGLGRIRNAITDRVSTSPEREPNPPRKY
jgi:hypothetical protein